MGYFNPCVHQTHLECLCQGSVSLVTLVLWQSPETPVMSCFYVSARLRVCSSRVLSVCVPCFVLERGVRIPALMSWLLVLWRGSDTRAPCYVLLCECAVSSSLGRALFWSRVLCFVLLHAVRVFIGCVHSCSVLCCVARSLCFSLAVCFHVVMSRGLWVFSLAACSCPVLHMAGDLFCWPCACVFVLCEHMDLS